jgi:hypothetical protein
MTTHSDEFSIGVLICPALARSFYRPAAAMLLWVAIIVFSVVGPVPINNRVKARDLQQLPAD